MVPGSFEAGREKLAQLLQIGTIRHDISGFKKIRSIQQRLLLLLEVPGVD